MGGKVISIREQGLICKNKQFFPASTHKYLGLFLLASRSVFGLIIESRIVALVPPSFLL